MQYQNIKPISQSVHEVAIRSPQKHNAEGAHTLTRFLTASETPSPSREPRPLPLTAKHPWMLIRTSIFVECAPEACKRVPCRSLAPTPLFVRFDPLIGELWTDDQTHTAACSPAEDLTSQPCTVRETKGLAPATHRLIGRCFWATSSECNCFRQCGRTLMR